MHCRNCGHTDQFVLLVELSALVADRASRADWTLSVECPSCASTDVAGDPATLLRRAID
ncbi:hypothetical protein [Halegenticoccus tardaugens]|uniref:hypothetical protein n=1 Tax=Halegenticoccus tardaugens TaxID=2071624 RepID=UPI0013E994AE|nr:hypothetical protein [Halegenticoccus tardaugens]